MSGSGARGRRPGESTHRSRSHSLCQPIIGTKGGGGVASAAPVAGDRSRASQLGRGGGRRPANQRAGRARPGVAESGADAAGLQLLSGEPGCARAAAEAVVEGCDC